MSYVGTGSDASDDTDTDMSGDENKQKQYGPQPPKGHKSNKREKKFANQLFSANMNHMLDSGNICRSIYYKIFFASSLS